MKEGNAAAMTQHVLMLDACRRRQTELSERLRQVPPVPSLPHLEHT